MLLPNDIFQGQRSPRQRRRRTPTGSAANVAARVLSVYLIDGTGALWVFDTPVSVTDGAACPQLRIQTASGWQGAASVGGVTPYLVACDYASGDLESGQVWEVVEQPMGLAFTGGAELVLPQSGETAR